MNSYSENVLIVEIADPCLGDQFLYMIFGPLYIFFCDQLQILFCYFEITSKLNVLKNYAFSIKTADI